MYPRDTALVLLSQPAESGSMPGPSNYASNLQLFENVDTTAWTGPLDELFLDAITLPDTVSSSTYDYAYVQYGMPYGMMQDMPSSSSKSQTHPLPGPSSPNLDYISQFGFSSMHNIEGRTGSPYSHSDELLDTAGALLRPTSIGNSYEKSQSHHWSPPSSSSRQIGNPQADSHESPRKRQKRKHEDMENHEGKYLSQYRRTFES